MAKDREEKIIRSWKENAGSWTTAVRTQAIESRRLATDQAILNAIMKLNGFRVLDVGCGEGWLSQRLADAGRQVTGFDACSQFIQQAQADSIGRFLVLSYDQLASDPFCAGRDYDVEVCNFSLLEENLAPVLSALRKIIKPTGHLIIQTVHPLMSGSPYQDGWREETFEALPGTWSPMPWYFRTISSWISALASSGWQIHECIEPAHPVTGAPVSLIFDAIVRS